MFAKKLKTKTKNKKKNKKKNKIKRDFFLILVISFILSLAASLILYFSESAADKALSSIVKATSLSFPEIFQSKVLNVVEGFIFKLSSP